MSNSNINVDSNFHIRIFNKVLNNRFLKYKKKLNIEDEYLTKLSDQEKLGLYQIVNLSKILGVVESELSSEDSKKNSEILKSIENTLYMFTKFNSNVSLFNITNQHVYENNYQANYTKLDIRKLVFFRLKNNNDNIKFRLKTINESIISSSHYYSLKDYDFKNVKNIRKDQLFNLDFFTEEFINKLKDLGIESVISIQSSAYLLNDNKALKGIELLAKDLNGVEDEDITFLSYQLYFITNDFLKDYLDLVKDGVSTILKQKLDELSTKQKVVDNLKKMYLSVDKARDELPLD